MKHLGKLAVLGAVLAASAPFASATPITGTVFFYGSDSFTSTSITVNSPAQIGSSAVIGEVNPTGSFAPLAGDLVTINSFTGSLPQLFLSGPSGLTFTLDNYTIVTQSATFWNITGQGMFTLNGFDPTLYDFSFTTTDSIGAGDTVSFNANAAATPEPSSLILLGTGLLGAAGTLVRKRRAA